MIESDGRGDRRDAAIVQSGFQSGKLQDIELANFSFPAATAGERVEQHGGEGGIAGGVDQEATFFGIAQIEGGDDKGWGLVRKAIGIFARGVAER